MIRNNSPEPFSYNRKPSNRRVKSEVPDFFYDKSTKKDPKQSFLQVSFNVSKFSNSPDSLLTKHREIILDLLKVAVNVSDETWLKLKEITQVPDLLTDVIYRKIRGDLISNISKNKQKEQLVEYRKFTSNLQTQLMNAKKSNDELTNMLLSVEVQQKLNRDLNESISLITSINSSKPTHPAKKRSGFASRLEYEKILHVAQVARDQDGLKVLCEEVRRSVLADNVIVLTPNAQNTYFSGIINGDNVKISAKATVLSTIFHSGQSISAKSGDTSFDPRIQQVLKTKIKAFSSGVLSDHLGHKIGLLLIIRKRPELHFERELPNILNIFSLFIVRWKLYKDSLKYEERIEQLLEAANEMLNSKILSGLLGKLGARLPSMFGCERANILMFDYERNNLFRKISETSYDNFPIFHGLSGHCVNTKKPIICNEVLAERLFNKEMDDPLGDNTRSILSVPLFSKVYEDIPEAVLQIINKVDGAYFNLVDQENLMNLSKMATNCLIVLKFSQMSASMIDLLKKLEESMERIHHEMNARQYDFGSVKSSIAMFKGFISQHFS